MPEKFDLNEWYVLGGLTVLMFIFVKLDPKLPRSMILSIFLFNAFLGFTTDYLLAGEYPLNLYDTMDRSYFDLFDFIVYSIVYPLYSYVFLHIYAKRKIKGRNLFVLWMIVSVCLEAMGHYAGVFRYRNWSLAYSALAYLLLFFVEIGYFRFVLRIYRRDLHLR